MQTKTLTDGGICVQLAYDDTEHILMQKAACVRPAEKQVQWQEFEFIAFIHFGINTYTNKEWGDGTESPELFNPMNFDADQWVRTIKEAEMKAVILTCKHHDGFCLWPSRYTEHSVKHSPWREGKGDVVREVADACQKYGIKMGIYLSPWDRHEQTYGSGEAYNTYYKNQLTELLTEYGEIVDVWLDGACAEGPNGKKQVYDWQGYFSHIHQLAPNATITGMGPDVRWCGNEAGAGREHEWSVVPVPGFSEDVYTSQESAEAFPHHNYTLAMTEDLGSTDTLKKHAKTGDWLCWYPAQVDTSIRPGWFYHPHEDQMVKSLSKMLKIYDQSVGNNAQLLLNLPPTPEGLLHEVDVKRLRELGEVLRRTYAYNLADEATIVQTYEGDEAVWTLTFESPVVFNTLVLGENIRKGQVVEAFEVAIKKDGVWHIMTTGSIIGYKQLLRLTQQGTLQVEAIRIRVTKLRGVPDLNLIGVYKAPIIVSAPEIKGDDKGNITIETCIPAQIYYTLDGQEPTQQHQHYIGPFELPRGGTVKAVAYYEEVPDGYFVEAHTVASGIFGVPISERTKLIEGHCVIEADLGQAECIEGFTMMPIQDGYDFNYNVSQYSFAVSMDGEAWHYVKEKQYFHNISHNPILQIEHFEEKTTARFVRFEAHDGLSGNACIVVGPISVLRAGQ
ncbi:MAG: alpha-L-fucosidase [Cellulosilyticaceae bacterium]